MNTQYSTLASRIEEALADLERVAARAQLMLTKALRQNDDGYFDAVALNLHGYYAGIERIFEDIARTVDGSLPSGPDWHRDLLLQMSSEISATRPPVITREVRHCLDEYRAFRHVVRNVYTFNLRPSRLQELTEELTGCHTDVTNNLREFISYLRQIGLAAE